MPVPSVKLLFGPMLIGVFFNTILYGVLAVQTYEYYRVYRKRDLPWIRSLVFWVFTVETINTAFSMFVMYEPLVLHYGQPLRLYPMLFAAEPIAVAAISTPIQFFFAWRIKAFTNSIWIPFLIACLGTLSLAGGLWTGIRIGIVKLLEKKPEFHKPALVWFLSACAADILITVTLVYNLSKRKTGFSSTDDVISKLIRTTVQTGLLTCICALGDVIFFMTIPHAAFNIAFDLTLAKLYGNCFMSTLNARRGLAEQTMETDLSRGADFPYLDDSEVLDITRHSDIETLDGVGVRSFNSINDREADIISSKGDGDKRVHFSEPNRD